MTFTAIMNHPTPYNAQFNTPLFDSSRQPEERVRVDDVLAHLAALSEVRHQRDRGFVSQVEWHGISHLRPLSGERVLAVRELSVAGLLVFSFLFEFEWFY